MSFIDKFSWFVNRLNKMPLPEIPWRISERVKKRADRIRKFENPSNSEAAFSESLFLLSGDNLSSIISDEQKKQIINGADRIIKNQLNIFGIDADFGDKINWHLDPVTENVWPEIFWGDIGIRNNTYASPKFVWELSRFYFMPVLGFAYLLTGEKKYSDKIFFLLKDWAENNPYPYGINWASGIELSVRLSNLFFALSLLKDYQFKNEEYFLLNKFVFFHAYDLNRYESKYSSNNNHAIAEAFGLFICGLYFFHLDGADKWFSKGKNILEREVERQILPDGGSFEYTTTYLSFVFDFFLFFKKICDENKILYPSVLNQKLEKSCDFISSLIDNKGNLANIGDQDSAVLINFGISNKENFLSILNTGAYLFNRNNFIRAGQPDFKTKIIYPDSISFFQENKNEQLNDESICFNKDSGISVIKGQIKSNGFVLTCNASSTGLHPLYAHGHLDALSFWLSINGKEVFVDPGTYLYGSSGEWRNYFRSTKAHNTIQINNKDIAQLSGDFMMSKPYKITEHILREKGRLVYWKAGHDGYRKEHSEIKRKMIWDKQNELFYLNDYIENKKNVFSHWFFHFAPECRVEQNDNAELLIMRDDLCLKMSFLQDMDCEIFKGSINPLLGWYSKDFNHIQEAFTVKLSKNLYIGKNKISFKIQLC